MQRRVRSPEEILEALEDDDAPGALHPYLGSIDVEHQLALAGVDRARFDADTARVVDGARRRRAQALRRAEGVRSTAGSRRAIAAGLAMAAAVALVVGATSVHGVRPGPSSTVQDHARDQALGHTGERGGAARLRDEAEAACARGEWTACETKLDEARAIDPAGDRADLVLGMRAAIALHSSASPPLSVPPRPSPARGGG